MDKPDLKVEKEMCRRGYQVVIGVDEVGRGALAGPVVAGACAIYNLQFKIYNKNSNFKLQISNWESLGIDDSKRLSAQKREELSKIIRKYAMVGIGEVGVADINKCGIVKATQKAMRSALRQAQGKHYKKARIFVLVDAFHVKYIPGVGLKNQKAIIKGDRKSVSIAAASIVAKVHRDKMMVKLGRKYPKYGWKQSKGYGTKKHLAAIRKYGVTRLHRLAFLPKDI